MRYKLLNTIYKSLVRYGIALSLLSFTACKKDKLDMKVDNRTLIESRSLSQARIINFGEYNQVVAGTDSLTNFITRSSTDPDYYKYPGTSYFPTNGRLGGIWTIPQDLFDSKSSVNLKISSRNYQGVGDRDLPVTAVDDYTKPMDYFLLPSNFVSGMKNMVAVPRGVSLPSKPDHFKIRVVNLGVKISEITIGPNGASEDIHGPVSLAYADGTLVNSKTNHVSSESIASEYVELPYGTYQFKLLLEDGRQIPSFGSEAHEYTLIDPSSSTIPLTYEKVSYLHYAPMMTYQPGGVYTIVVSPRRYAYFADEVDNTADLFQNSFQLITDVAPEANRTYFRAQGANAYKSQAVTFNISGVSLGSAVSFGNATDYINLIQGDYTIEAKDAGGKVLATLQQSLRAAQNYTFWLYETEQGNPTILAVANDLSGVLPRGSGDDATFSRYENHFYFFKRFLNLSVGNPYITFTLGNGQDAGQSYDNAASAQNLQPGVPKIDRPYLLMGEYRNPFEILAYRSTPNMIPGLWADDIPVLSSDVFIANKNLYDHANRPRPVQEAGVYTVALIGKTTKEASQNEKAKMIIVKHNK
ncbi:hypothetical protein D3C87_237020 [compost metagenome]